MKNSVIAIGLDAAEPKLLEKLMSQGHLKNLNHLRQHGTYTRLQNFDHHHLAEVAWTTCWSGCLPTETGYWSTIKFHPDVYEAKLIKAYDFNEYPPFYALGQDYRVAAFDIPQTALSERVNGLQVLAWGAHSPQTPRCSLPRELFQNIIDQHGIHPAFFEDHASPYNLTTLYQLEEKLLTGIARRSAICQDLLKQEPWNLFLTVFSETHSAGHTMWHLSQTNHLLYDIVGSRASHDSFLACYQAIDQAIGEILSQAPQDAYIIIFSVHGMDTNIIDLPSGTFLPEFLYRFNFSGKFGLAKGNSNTTPANPLTKCKKNSFKQETWCLKEDSNVLRKFLRRKAPYRIFKRVNKFLKPIEQPDLISPYELIENADPFDFQPTEWYKSCWPYMKAFALPSFSEGYIRINLQGRESQGIVAAADYENVCEEISNKLYALKDARTGIPMVKNIVRTRRNATDNHHKYPDADLLVIWQDEFATDVVDSPDFGRIGPIPFSRTGGHRGEGFFLAKGPHIQAGVNLSKGQVIDVAPTILTLMNAPIPDYCAGKSLLKIGRY